MSYEYLKPMFGNGPLTFEQLTEKLDAAEGVKLVNLKDGGYVGKEKLDAAEARVSALQLDYAIRTALTEAKAKNPEKLAKLIDRDGLKMVDGKLVGLDEQLKALKESDGYLFEGDKPAPEIVKPGSPVYRTPAGGGDLDAFYANNPFYKKKT